jgi:tetratricopeptide (TPR) repeat protein
MRFVAADPDDRWSRLALAENLRRMGQTDRADSLLDRLPRHDADANVIRAQIAFDRQEMVRANECLDLGKSDDPRLARLRGRQALALRDGRSAVRHFRIAFAADPNDHETLFGLQSALELSCNDQEAKPIRDAAHKLDRLNTLLQRARAGEATRDPELLRQLGTTCAALRRNDEARAWLELAIARDPLDSESQQSLFRLRAAIPGSAQSRSRQH